MRMRIKMKTLLFVNLGGTAWEKKTELDMKDDLVILGYVGSHNWGSAAPLPLRRVRNLDQNGHSRVCTVRCVSQNSEQRLLQKRGSWGPGQFNGIPGQQKSLQATPRFPSKGQTAHNLARTNPLPSVLGISLSVY